MCMQSYIGQTNSLPSYSHSRRKFKRQGNMVVEPGQELDRHAPAEALPSGMSCVFITNVRMVRLAKSSCAFCGVPVGLCSGPEAHGLLCMLAFVTMCSNSPRLDSMGKGFT